MYNELGKSSEAERAAYIEEDLDLDYETGQYNGQRRKNIAYNQTPGGE